jgi:hypothetical protein
MASYGKHEHKPVITKIPWTCEDSLDLPTADWSIELTHNASTYPDGSMRVRFWGSEAEAMKEAILDLDLKNQVTMFHWKGFDFEMYLKSWSYTSALHGYDNLLIDWDLVVVHA